MTLTADELIFQTICATFDIETILGRNQPRTKSAKYRFTIVIRLVDTNFFYLCVRALDMPFKKPCHQFRTDLYKS